MDLFDVKNKKAIVTGSTRGLGYSMAEGLMEAGAEVVIVGTSDKVLDVAANFCKQGFKCHGVKGNFEKREDVYNLALGGRLPDCANPRKKVYMYDLNGNFEREFDCVNAAGRFLNPSAVGAGHLPRAIKEGHQFLGHQFSYDKVPYMKELKYRHITTVDKPYIGKKVGRYDDNNKLLEIYDNMTECVKAGYKNAKLVAQGKRDHCKGFIFKYLD